MSWILVILLGWAGINSVLAGLWVLLVLISEWRQP